MVEPTSRDQNTRQKWGQGKGGKKDIYKEDEVLGVQTDVARQSRVVPPATKRNKKSSTLREDGRSQLRRTACERWRWIGRTELDGR